MTYLDLITMIGWGALLLWALSLLALSLLYRKWW